MSGDKAEAEKMPLTSEQEIEKKRRVLSFLRFLGLFFMFVGVLMMALLGGDAVYLAEGAREVTIAEIAEIAPAQRLYVSLSDATWHCDSITYLQDEDTGAIDNAIDTGYTDIVVTNAEGTVAIMVQQSGQITCEAPGDAMPTGFIYAPDESLITENPSAQTLLNEASTVLILCSYCGLENSQMGLMLGGVVFLIGVGFFGFIAYVRREQSSV